MLNKRLMTVVDIADMPERIAKCVHRMYRDIDLDAAVLFTVPTKKEVDTYGYDSKNKQQISEYLISEGIEPGTNLLLYRDW